MPLIRTLNDNSPIKLSVTIKNNHYGNTTITLNGNPLKNIGDSFVDLIIGTNAGLKNNTVAVVTTVMITNSNTHTAVDFDLIGAKQPRHDPSEKTAEEGVNYVSHYIEYAFV